MWKAAVRAQGIFEQRLGLNDRHQLIGAAVNDERW
jgi:hypothetical protein